MIKFANLLKVNYEFFNMLTGVSSAVALSEGTFFTTFFCNILRNSLKGEFYVYFDFLLYLKYTSMFRKSKYNLFNLSWLLKYLPIYSKRFSESVDGSKYELKDSAVSWFSEINLSFSINVTLEGHYIKVCSRNMVCKSSKMVSLLF